MDASSVVICSFLKSFVSPVDFATSIEALKGVSALTTRRFEAFPMHEHVARVSRGGERVKETRETVTTLPNLDGGCQASKMAFRSGTW